MSCVDVLPGARVLEVTEPLQGSVVLFMLPSPAPDDLSWAMCFAWVVARVEKSRRILSLCLRSACSPEMLSLSLERVGRQDPHTTSITAP